jgi:hypothetical protein
MTFRLGALFCPAGFAEAAESLNERVLAMGVDIQPHQPVAGGVEDVSAVGAPAGIAAWSEQADAGPSWMPEGNPERTAVRGDKYEAFAVRGPVWGEGRADSEWQSAAAVAGAGLVELGASALALVA